MGAEKESFNLSYTTKHIASEKSSEKNAQSSFLLLTLYGSLIQSSKLPNFSSHFSSTHSSPKGELYIVFLDLMSYFTSTTWSAEIKLQTDLFNVFFREKLDYSCLNMGKHLLFSRLVPKRRVSNGNFP